MCVPVCVCLSILMVAANRNPIQIGFRKEDGGGWGFGEPGGGY